ncbi:MAG: anaerobic C4-dicarboxylate transporter [Xanthomonadales bacterium]|jgi:anaerobic C4-dicarboxylate transporter DcuA|nr:anaerobic C4-dicarboxylate transporter [Xanthomonadales bacterium]
MVWLELALFLACIVVGARIGGIGLGTIAGFGLVIFVFVFRLPPGSPPGTVLGMIIAVITALSVMQAAGGLDFLVQSAESVLRRRPRQVTFLGPLVTYLLVFAAGTQHVIYALLPVIAEVSRRAGIRPERPLSISVIAALQGVIASPVSAVTVALAGVLAVQGVGLPQILLIVIPSTVLGIAAGIGSVWWRGAELTLDPEYLQRLQEGKVKPVEETVPLRGDARKRAIGSCIVFLLAILAVVAIGMFPGLRPEYQKLVEGVTETGQVEMGRAIMIVMLCAAGVMMVLFRASPEAAVKGSMMKGGLVALISILGVSWLGSSFVEANEAAIVSAISGVIQAHPWIFAAGLFAMSILLFSQAATVMILAPIGIALGLGAGELIGAYPSVNGLFFLPTYGTILAAVSFDQTGTTHIGKYLLNHSFMVPGLVTTAVATLAAMGLCTVLL